MILSNALTVALDVEVPVPNPKERASSFVRGSDPYEAGRIARSNRESGDGHASCQEAKGRRES